MYGLNWKFGCRVTGTILLSRNYSDFGTLREDGKWEGIMKVLQERNADVALCDMSITSRRLDDVDFTDTICDQSVSAYMRLPTRRSLIDGFFAVRAALWTAAVGAAGAWRCSCLCGAGGGAATRHHQKTLALRIGCLLPARAGEANLIALSEKLHEQVLKGDGHVLDTIRRACDDHQTIALLSTNFLPVFLRHSPISAHASPGVLARVFAQHWPYRPQRQTRFSQRPALGDVGGPSFLPIAAARCWRCLCLASNRLGDSSIPTNEPTTIRISPISLEAGTGSTQDEARSMPGGRGAVFPAFAPARLLAPAYPGPRTPLGVAPTHTATTIAFLHT
ncbi:Protein of unknown function [Gryllus bimaculatus]|nr:Protein of unknown function [Gryllus bimaculatus]